jgi:hypothetical protein
MRGRFCQQPCELVPGNLLTIASHSVGFVDGDEIPPRSGEVRRAGMRPCREPFAADVSRWTRDGR